MDGSLFERGKSLEDHFFSEKDKQLLAQLKQDLAQKVSREALSNCSGITDGKVLDALLANGITAESITSFSLVPLVAVAWADGRLDEQERQAIMKASQSVGIEPGSVAQRLLQSWLEKSPPSQLLAAWKDYVASLKKSLDETAFSQVRNTVMRRARDVAEAAGGFLGIGKTSEKEAAVIDDLEDSFG
jgi:hypothetical protein